MRRLGLFAKPPRIGHVKSRLSPALPAALACDLYRGLLAGAIELLEGADAHDRRLFWSDAPAAGDVAPGPGVRVELQRGADLGERLANAFRELLETPDDRAVFFGADGPWLERATIARVFAALERHDAAIVPARDGGYLVIGLARFTPALFQRIDWGTERVLAQTLERAREAGLDVETLEPLEDLDTPENLVRALARLAAAPDVAPALRGPLEAMGLLARPLTTSSRPPGSAAR